MYRFTVHAFVGLLALAGFIQSAHADSVFSATGVNGALGAPAYGMRMDGFYDGNTNTNVTFSFNNVTFTEFTSGGAELKGSLTVNRGLPNGVNANYNLDVLFNSVPTPSMGNANYKYFLISNTGHELVNTSDANDYASLSSYPTDGSMPFQVGYGANNKDSNFGAAGWLNWTHHFDDATLSSNTGGHGDFALDMDPVPEPSTMVLGLSAMVLGLGWGGTRYLRPRLATIA